MQEYDKITQTEKEWKAEGGEDKEFKAQPVSIERPKTIPNEEKPTAKLVELEMEDGGSALQAVEIVGEVDGAEILTTTEPEKVPYPEGEKSADSLRERFGYALSEKEIETTVKENITPHFLKKLRIPTGRLPEYEQFYQEYEATRKKPNIDIGSDEYMEFDRYQDLRDLGLTHTEILSFIEHAENGPEKVTEYYMQLLKNEREQIAAAFSSPETKQKIADSFEQLRQLYAEAGLTPNRSGLPLTQFAGNMERMVFQIREGSGMPSPQMSTGAYYPQRDAALVFVSPENMGTLSDAEISVAIHENTHGLSENKVCKSGQELGDLDIASAKRLKSGFLTMNANSRRRLHSLVPLTEGFTELIARVVARKSGLEINTQSDYGNFVQDALALSQLLEGKPVDTVADYGNIEPASLKVLLENYQLKSGTLKLARHMSEMVGPKALMLFDLFSSYSQDGFRKFARACQEVKAGRPAEDVEVPKGSLANYGMKIEELKSYYPFLRESDGP